MRVDAKRSLTHVGGAVETGGDEERAKELAHALDVEPAGRDSDEPERAHVHGFHTYPARMHPETASRLVRALAPKNGVVLDPFCGSGTVLVEAMLAGRRAIGADLNPLAVRIARAKTLPRDAEGLGKLVENARIVAEYANTRRKAKAGATRKFPDEDRRLFEPHVLLELDSIRAALEGQPTQKHAPHGGPRARALADQRDARLKDLPAIDKHAAMDLWLVLSAILMKVSNQRADTTARTETRRIAAGYASKLFVKKTEELVRRLEELSKRAPKPKPRVLVAVDDATKLESVKRNSIDTIVTSPPYAATYDYAAHHALRMRWLGLDPEPLEQGELGARRKYANVTHEAAVLAWQTELSKFFRAAARVTVPGALMALVIADSAVKGGALRADDIVAAVAEETRVFAPVARASQHRPHFHTPTDRAFQDAPRAEHVLLLERT